MKKINYPMMPILAVVIIMTACSQKKSELTDSEKASIKTEVEDIVNKIYNEQFPALDYKGTLATGTKDAYMIEGMYGYSLSDPNVEKSWINLYSKLSKRESKVVGLKTVVLSSNSAYSTFNFTVTNFFKEKDSTSTVNGKATFIFTQEGKVWRIKHGHISYKE